MKIITSVIAAGVLGLCPIVAQAKIERLVEKSFAVQPGSHLRVSTEGGHITLKPGADGTVSITARQKVRANTEARADELLKDLELTLEQSGDGITAAAKYLARKSGWGSGGRLVQVDFEITVPAALNAELRTSGGHIKVGDLQGNLTARTSGGQIQLGHIRGEVKAGTSGGSVTLAQASGPVELRTSDGSITVGNLRGRMQARARQGTIFFRQIDGSVDARTEKGDVVVSRCTGAVTLRTVQGSIRIGTIGGRASLETVDGDIEFQAAHAPVVAVTRSGDITAGFAAVAGGSQVRTALGNITAQVNPDAAFALRAQSGWGPVEAKLPFENEGNGRSGRLSGLRNGGGPLLELSAGGGRVTIAPDDTFLPL
ncbi:MAG: hypothetical protein RLZZ129_1222 [Verrucomicrobiota bacterium]|jgi:hypothetical protein